MWKEFLDADTYAKGPGSTVAKVVDGTLEGTRSTGIAGVANTGSDTNWTGHDFAQANWYAFGRLAWDPALTAEAIADEWIRMTWSTAPDVVAAIRDDDAALARGVRGLHDAARPPPPHRGRPLRAHAARTPTRAAPTGPRPTTTARMRAASASTARRPGSDAVAQYRSPLREQWADPATVPERLLLWFHHVPWDRTMGSGRTLWDELVRHYERGAEEARGFEERWTALRGRVDAERHRAVLGEAPPAGRRRGAVAR